MAKEPTLDIDAFDIPGIHAPLPRRPLRLWRGVLRRRSPSATDHTVQQYPQQASESRRPLRITTSQKQRDRTIHSYGYDGHSAHTSVSGDSLINTVPLDSEFRRGRSLQRSVAADRAYSPDYAEFDESECTQRTSGHEDDHLPTNGHYRPGAHVQSPIARKPSDSFNSTNYTDAACDRDFGGPVDRGFGGPGDRSSADSDLSHHTVATSIQTLHALQTKGPDNSDAQHLDPVLEDDPRSWDLVPPAEDAVGTGMYALEQRAEQLLSAQHLHTIFDDPKMLLKFTGFLNSHRPASIAILIYYLDALKALRAINYANAISEALVPLKGHAFTQTAPETTVNVALEEKAEMAFELLVRDDLPAYITHVWIQVVSVSIQRRIAGTLAPHLREASEGLAEVFCLTDPSRTDNPIVFASEEFTRTTQYGMNYAIGRNCRFLQGPRTSPCAVRRLADATRQNREHSEIFVNYRRDGSPFLNLLMIAPLMDSRGNTRYFIGAQVDVSGLLKECSNLESLVKLVEREQRLEAGEDVDEKDKDPFQELSEMFNGAELDTVRRHGGRMHKEYVDDTDNESIHGGRPRLLLNDPSQDPIDKQRQAVAEGLQSSIREKLNGKLEGVYQHYLLVRPSPSLRILFTSPSLRVPGILQSPFLHRIGGSNRVRQDLVAALAEGRGVTAKIRWLTRADPDGDGEGRPRWIHCTPLLGHSGAVGVWMVVLVDDESSRAPNRRFRPAPPVATTIGGKEWDGRVVATARERRPGGKSDRDDHQQSRPSTAHQNGRASREPSLRHSTSFNEDTLHPSNADPSEFSFQLK